MIFMKFRSPQSAFKGLLNYSVALTLFLFIGNIQSGTLHTNTYSVCAAVMVCLALSAYRNNLFSLKEMKPYIFAGLFFLLIGTSSASNLSFLCALIFIYSFKHNRFYLSFFLITFISLFAAYYFGKRIIFKILFPRKSFSNITSLSGRLYLWKGYIQIWLKRPLVGWGFAVGERAGKSFGFMYALSAHNGYLSILINTGRGPLVCEEDVAEALMSGGLYAYCADVLTEEPPRADNPLLKQQNAYITPHIAWATIEARVRLVQVATDNVRAFLKGTPQNTV